VILGKHRPVRRRAEQTARSREAQTYQLRRSAGTDFGRVLGEPSQHSLFARIVAIFAIVFNSTEIGPCPLAIIMTLEVLLSEIEVQNGHLYWKDS
jgi:hypothetical protein